MKKKQESGTSVRLADEIKPWIYRKMQVENRSLGNIINTCLKREKDKEERPFVTPVNISIEALREWLKDDKNNTQ